MKKEQVALYHRYEYKKQCENCGEEHTLLTQQDSSPEYYASVYSLCSCGDYVAFKLPVN